MSEPPWHFVSPSGVLHVVRSNEMLRQLGNSDHKAKSGHRKLLNGVDRRSWARGRRVGWGETPEKRQGSSEAQQATITSKKSCKKLQKILVEMHAWRDARAASGGIIVAAASGSLALARNRRGSEIGGPAGAGRRP